MERDTRRRDVCRMRDKRVKEEESKKRVLVLYILSFLKRLRVMVVGGRIKKGGGNNEVRL